MAAAPDFKPNAIELETMIYVLASVFRREEALNKFAQTLLEKLEIKPGQTGEFVAIFQYKKIGESCLNFLLEKQLLKANELPSSRTGGKVVYYKLARPWKEVLVTAKEYL